MEAYGRTSLWSATRLTSSPSIFARLDYNTRPIQGVIVQRVNMSPLFVKQLIDALAANLADYGRSMPDGMNTEEDP